MVLQPHSLPQREVKHVLRSPACLPSSGEVAKPKVLTEGFSRTPRKGISYGIFTLRKRQYPVGHVGRARHEAPLLAAARRRRGFPVQLKARSRVGEREPAGARARALAALPDGGGVSRRGLLLHAAGARHRAALCDGSRARHAAAAAPARGLRRAHHRPEGRAALRVDRGLRAGAVPRPEGGHRCRRAQRLEGDGRRYDGLGCPPHGGHGRESGPAISRCCFETGPEVPEAVRALLGSDAEGLCPPEEGVEGKFLVDLKETNRRRLLQLGLVPEHIDVSPDCTMCMQDVYWSHRATKGRRGTMASVIML